MSEADNTDTVFWEQVCRNYGFGELLAAPRPVAGGFQHRMWRVDTSAGPFAVKILHARCAEDPDCRRRCFGGERIARRAADADLPAVAALESPEGPLRRFGGAAVLCYGWEEGTTLPPTPAPPARAGLIGGLLGRLHALNLPWGDDSPPSSECFPAQHWHDLAQRVKDERLSLAFALPDLLAWNEATREATDQLNQGWVVSHRDLDQKNVLWRAAAPRLLDWEAAGPVHPALEVMGTALNWAGQSAGPPDQAVFRAFLAGYRRQAPLDADALGHAATAVLGKWLVWLEVCLRRALDAAVPEEQTAALGSAAHALATLRVLAAALPDRLAWINAGKEA